jgi:hypothetical protein
MSKKSARGCAICGEFAFYAIAMTFFLLAIVEILTRNGKLDGDNTIPTYIERVYQ